MKIKSIKASEKFNLPFLFLNKKEAEKFSNAIDNPPKANKALKELLKEVKKKRTKTLFSFFN